MKIVVSIPLTQVIRQRNIKEKAFNDGLSFKSRCRTLDKCNHLVMIVLGDLDRREIEEILRNHTVINY
jgi:hypothetical protein